MRDIIYSVCMRGEIKKKHSCARIHTVDARNVFVCSLCWKTDRFLTGFMCIAKRTTGLRKYVCVCMCRTLLSRCHTLSRIKVLRGGHRNRLYKG